VFLSLQAPGSSAVTATCSTTLHLPPCPLGPWLAGTGLFPLLTFPLLFVSSLHHYQQGRHDRWPACARYSVHHGDSDCESYTFSHTHCDSYYSCTVGGTFTNAHRNSYTGSVASPYPRADTGECKHALSLSLSLSLSRARVRSHLTHHPL
jgi:hypothetical protein